MGIGIAADVPVGGTARRVPHNVESIAEDEASAGRRAAVRVREIVRWTSRNESRGGNDGIERIDVQRGQL